MIIVWVLHSVNIYGQSNCDITFSFVEDRITFNDNIYCAKIKVEGFQDITSIEMGVQYPTEFLQYINYQNDALQGLIVEPSDSNLGYCRCHGQAVHLV